MNKIYRKKYKIGDIISITSNYYTIVEDGVCGGGKTISAFDFSGNKFVILQNDHPIIKITEIPIEEIKHYYKTLKDRIDFFKNISKMLNSTHIRKILDVWLEKIPELKYIEETDKYNL